MLKFYILISNKWRYDVKKLFHGVDSAWRKVWISLKGRRRVFHKLGSEFMQAGT